MADGAASFRQDSSGPALLRIPVPPRHLRVPDFHRLWPAFPGRSASCLRQMFGSYNPGRALTPPVWAPPRSLATTWGIILIFSSSGYLDVSVHRVCPRIAGDAHRCAPGCPIRTSADQGPFAPPRGFSQLVTSFFASKSLGIPHALLSNLLVAFARFHFLTPSTRTCAPAECLLLASSILSKNFVRALRRVSRGE